MRRAWSILSTVILIAVFFLFIVFAGIRLVGLTPYTVASGSMEPEYPVGSLIYVREISPQEIREGDVITFYLEDGKTVATHQVYKIDREEELFYTQGINNRDSEGNILQDASPVAYSSVLGCPAAVIPYLGYVNHFCATAPGIYILIGTAVLVPVISIFIDRWNGKEVQDRKKEKSNKKKRGT